MIRVNSQSFTLSSTLKKKNYEVHQHVPSNANHNNGPLNAQTYSNVAALEATTKSPVDRRPPAAAGEHLGLQYVTERILAAVLPERQTRHPAQRRNNGTANEDHDDDDVVQLRHHNNINNNHSDDDDSDNVSDAHERQLLQMLEQKHEKNYKLFDLESCIATITLERLCELCKHMEAWLNAGRNKVVVLQDRGQKQRLGTAIAAYLEYLDICSAPTSPGQSSAAVNTIARNWLNMDMTAMKKFLDAVIGPLRVPSQRRYLEYFSGLLSGQIKMNAAPLYLRYVSVDAPPTWLNYDPSNGATDGNGNGSDRLAEWRTFVKIYEGLTCVYTSDIHVVPLSTRQFVFDIAQPLRLRGDVIVRCYHIVPSVRVYQERRELILSAQFHTCAITGRSVAFDRSELDYACDDSRFPSDHRITLHFEQSVAQPADYMFQSPLVKVEPITSIAQYDSLENLDDASSQHTQGPLDGSLYATILKSPRTPPDQRPASTFPFPAADADPAQRNSNHHQSAVALISPPPEFLNADTSPTNGTASHHQQQQTQHHHQLQRIELQRSQSCTPQPQHLYANRSTSQQPTPVQPASQRPGYQSLQPGVRPSSAQSLHHHQQQRSLNGQHPSVYHSFHQHRSTAPVQPAPPPRTSSAASTSVHSALTLSMDSGIASSGATAANHRELDDILSNMLQTVQNIPDMHTGNGNNGTLRPKPQSSNAKPTADYNSETIKRSPKTYQQQQQLLHQQQQQQLYESSSNAATPTPSEAGRQTPTAAHHQRDAARYQQVGGQQSPADRPYQNLTTLRHAQTLNGYATPTGATTSNANASPTSGGRSSSASTVPHHSFVVYPPQQTTSSNSSARLHPSDTDTATADDTEDDTIETRSLRSHRSERSDRTAVSTASIPYHAREDSRPFTYGPAGSVQLHSVSEHEDDSPTQQHPQQYQTGTGMLKMQSGLSSPSLVRRTLQPVQTNGGHKSPTVRNDFEEMLRQRREKVLLDTGGKYSIGDRATTPASCYEKRTTTTTTSHQQQLPFEPLRRSNTMDYGSVDYARSHSSDGSGQTWLQLQQQKLRAKKQIENGVDVVDYQPVREHRVYHHGSQQTLTRAPRSRSSAARYDDYASDTGTYGGRGAHDEVDYRRPLHVQTPPATGDRIGYQTKTTSQTMLASSASGERPFVAVKRAHHALHSNASSRPTSPLSALYASPLGQVPHVQQQQQSNGHGSPSNGLLVSIASSDANNNNMSPTSSNGPKANGSANGSPASRISQNGQTRLVREESFSSYRSETDADLSLNGSPRPETPAFPVTPRTPYGLSAGILHSPALPPKSPNSMRKDMFGAGVQQHQQQHNVHFVHQNDTVSCSTSRRNSNTSTTISEPQDVPSHLVKFVRDSSQFWYKPTISREEAVALLRHAAPGTFIVRDSTTFAKAYGLVVKVAFPPAGIPARPTDPHADELVRHFLVEPTTRGVRLKGCANEPVFTSLSALVYQHSITPLALPCRLLVPDHEGAYGPPPSDARSLAAAQQLLSQGAACNVLYLFTCDTESLTGPEAVRKAIGALFERKPLPLPTTVHFKVAQQGITLTDNTRQLFFRKHYPAANISHCGLDPDDRRWSIRNAGDVPVVNKSLFAFVARRSGSVQDNQCHVFCELEPTQPATAITSFANKVVPGIGNAAARNI